MKPIKSQPKLIGLAGELPSTESSTATLEKTLKAELAAVHQLFDSAGIVSIAVSNENDFLLLRICAKLRIPMVLFLARPFEELRNQFNLESEKTVAEALMGIALAKYEFIDSEGFEQAYAKALRACAEFADTLLIIAEKESDANTTNHALELAIDAKALGTPCKIADSNGHFGNWTLEPQSSSPAKHGFENRKELLEFFDAKFLGITREN